MGNSLDFIQPRDKAIECLEDGLSKMGVVVTSTKDINSGLGIKYHLVKEGESFSLILYFNNKSQQSSKVVFEKAKREVILEFQSKISNQEEQQVKEHKTIPIYVSVDIQTEEVRNGLKDDFGKLNIEIDDCDRTEHEDYRIRLHDNDEHLTVTQYSSGKLLVQGVYSQLVDRVVDVIDRHKPLTNVERALLFVPKEAQSSLKKDIESRHNVFDDVQQEGGANQDALIEYLVQNDKQTYFTGEGLIEILKDSKVNLPEYNFVIAQYAKVFEGFIIKILIDKKFFTLDQYRTDPNIADIGNALRKAKLKKYIKDQRRNGHVIESLIATWEGSRCKEMHSDPVAEKDIISIPTLEEAVERVGGIKSCMKDAYRILIEHGLSDADLKANTTEENLPEVDVINAFNSIIGIDESGKGDYFGPLVIVGVLVDASDEGKLIELGVKDSKKLSDKQVKKISSEIVKVMGHDKINIVAISAEKYNTLYSKMKNLNRLLAWGHARVLENLLEKYSCDGAISDQFGDEQFLNNALMKKGKSVKLIQMPKAEKNIAVAAASIIARNVFVEQLEHLCRKYNVPTAKGASDKVVDVAKAIVAKHGKEELSKVIKMHFKTTDKVMI